ncbi:dehydrogenase [bacterium]|nr:dehydrogenase [bacterium]
MKIILITITTLMIPGLIGCASLRRGIIGMISFDEAKASSATMNGSLAPSQPAPDKSDQLRLDLVANGFLNITDVEFMPGESATAVVLEKAGKAYRLNLKDNSRAELFTVPVKTESELGLLGFAFHPQFTKNRKFFVHYNPRSDLSRISEWLWVENQKTGALSCTEQRVLLEVEQPYQNHNGGSLVFGPDGLLYIGFGDGGWRGDPENRSQDMSSLLGKMLRIDVNTKPGDAVKPEIFARGLRNPWKYSFDSKGRLVAGDVGQDKWEEITFVERGANLGWRVFEGSHCYDPSRDCDKALPGAVGPIAEYDHELGKSVTGGFEYRGSNVIALKGRYVFGDFVSGRIWSIPLPEKTPAKPLSGKELKDHGKWDILISTFAEDASGEIFVADYGGGGIYLIKTAPNRY